MAKKKKNPEEEKQARKRRREERKKTGRAAKKRREEAKGTERLTGEVGVIISDGEHIQCLICGKAIKRGQKYRRLPPDAKSPEWRFYHVPDCGPGTEAWFKFHPSRSAELMLKSQESEKEKRIARRERKRIREGKAPLSREERMKHLEPMKPVEVPKEVMKKQPKEIQKLLEKLNSLKDRSSKEGAVLRKQLRKLGFKLSQFRK